MTNEEFLDGLPFMHGVAWAGIAEGKAEDAKHLASLHFWMAPRVFALCDLARKHPEEFAGLVARQERAAEERYGAESWAEQEPKREGAKT